MRIRPSPIAAVAAAVLLAAPAAAAAQFERLYSEYQQSGGRIEACAHSTEELSGALGEIPADIQAYDPDFAAALNRALDRRIEGCGGEAEPGPEQERGTVVGADGSPGPTPPRQVRIGDLDVDEPGFPLALVGAMVAAAALLGASAAIAVARRQGAGRAERRH